MGFWWEAKYVQDRRIQIAFLSALGFGLVVGLYQGVLSKQIMGRNKGEKIAYFIEAMWEAAFFGFGIGFFCIYGLAIKGLERDALRSRCIGIWIAISYFFMSWWPHAAMHQWLTPFKPTDFMILEICFHWPNLFAGLVLSYYQFDVLLISHSVAVNNKELRGWSEADTKPAPWYKDIKIHSIVLSVIFSVLWAIFQWHFNPYFPFFTPWQKGVWISIYITDGIASGVAVGFLYGATRLAHRLPKQRTRNIAALSIAAVTYLLTIATPHAVAHRAVALDPVKVLVIEYTFHLSITSCVAILGFYQHRFLVLALDGRMGMMMKFKNSNGEGSIVVTESTEMTIRNGSSQEDPSNSGVTVEVD